MKKNLLSLFFALVLLFLLSAPAAAAGDDQYIFDEAALLSESEAAKLEETAAELSSAYACGVYLVTADDFTDYGGSSIADFAEAFYLTYDLGIGTDKNGILLALSMAERDYDLCAYGSFAHATFTDRGKDVLADAFLDDLRDDDWYSGFSNYLQASGELLSSGGETTLSGSASRDFSLPFALAPALIVALIVCLIFLRQMKTARRQRAADAYVTERGVNMYIQKDIFTHRTQQRQVIESQSHSTHVNSGGFSHKSGKF